jgi:aspartyl-tRNA(Asn)/glutamyl-tRNA(Gln) amidotransferase subunit C
MSPMPSIGRDDVARLADLARIQLTEEEIVRFAGEFDSIMDAVASVSEVATEEVPATSHPIAMTNVFREDVVENTLTQEQALAGAPEAQDGRFAVPQILGEE